MQPTGKTKCTTALGQLQNSRSRFELILLIGFSFKYKLTYGVFSRERFTTVTAYRGFVTKS